MNTLFTAILFADFLFADLTFASYKKIKKNVDRAQCFNHTDCTMKNKNNLDKIVIFLMWIWLLAILFAVIDSA